jgi:hypothetical protein
MRVSVVALVAAVAVACGTERPRLVMVPSSNRLTWAGELGRVDAVPHPTLAMRVDDAATASGARVLDLTTLSVGEDYEPAVAVTLQVSDPAPYMKHRLHGFLERIRYFEPDRFAFVELVDDDGRFAWAAGRWKNGGMVGSRPELDECSPIVHSQPVSTKPNPCPVD